MLKQSFIISLISIMSMQCAASQYRLEWYIQTPGGTMDRWDYMGEVSDEAKETSLHQARVDQRYTQTQYKLQSQSIPNDEGNKKLYTYYNVNLVPAYIARHNIENNATIVNAAKAAAQEKDLSKKDIIEKLAGSVKTYKNTGQPRQVESYKDIIQNLNDDQKAVIKEAGEKSIELGKAFVERGDALFPNVTYIPFD